MALWGQLGFQDAASPLMEQLIFLHDHAMLVLILIITVVGYVAVSLVTSPFISRNEVDGQELETIWTILPAVFLVFLGLPSLRLLYLLDEVGPCALTIKSVGHQWYWSYEYSDFLNIEFDSYMVPSDELDSGQFRLLEVDHRAVVPVNANIRVLVSSADVIHSWTVPSLGVKADAIPGRLNQLSLFIQYPGVFYGQCSEICGANHSFMPIVLEAVEIDDFAGWVAELGLDSN
uniref:Cytochrome c oxidase subunit 2 n=2 Tax=Tegulidae TaxID=1955470 RepID=A0A3B8CKY0_9VEST|nr:cytochrome c oxidase subunit II [Tegula argyrostoma]YP_010131267.1 cytochrome c oxidase subunit II [Omphalius rusticus]AOZ71806.1 cytochrome c oxidase subunit II [Tegula argyrostoma]AYJ22279.1 cytochrome c oxidase subunit II [Omphalius rusticus]QPZ75998.1 cytochrome c oxidase subunit II [Omphalius rusticus]UUJ34972.1 cytochrome c oxidase subunit II [Omphalius rusticus]